jgi:hypothetical protein
LEWKQQMGYPSSLKKGIWLRWGNVVSLGKRLSTTGSVRDDSLMKTTLLATSLEQLTLGMTLLNLKLIGNVSRTDKLGTTPLKLKLISDITGTANVGDDTFQIEIEIEID